MKQVQGCLSAREDRESSFHRCGGPVSLLHACLCAEKAGNRRFNLRGSIVKQVQASFSTREDRESSFHRCGGPVMLVQACLCAGVT